MRLQHILVPVDFSGPSLYALDYAIALGQPRRTSFTLLTVVQPLYYSGGLDVILAEQTREARDALVDLERRLRRRGITARTLVRTGVSYRVIVHEARRQKADLIVMGTHGHTGLARMLIGSVAERVVSMASGPVLTVRDQRNATVRKRVGR